MLCVITEERFKGNLAQIRLDSNDMVCVDNITMRNLACDTLFAAICVNTFKSALFGIKKSKHICCLDADSIRRTITQDKFNPNINN